MWIERRFEAVLSDVVARRPGLVLTGTRQAGKTSILRRSFPDHRYVSLDLPLLAAEADESGRDFLARHPPPVLIDEVQHAPGLLPYVKVAIDERRHEVGQFLLTGSQRFPLMQHVTESLAGRVAVLECHPLSCEELERHYGVVGEGERLVEWMWKGGYPELHAAGLDPGRFYADLAATYLERDVRQLIRVRSLRDFDRFIRLAASRTGQLVSASSLAGDLGVSPNTVRSWLSVLEASNVVALVRPFSRNVGKRIIKTPKLFFLDTGLAAFLLGFRAPADLRSSGLLGAFFETHVISQVVRWHANRGLPADLYFFRDHAGNEVDLVIPVGEKLRLYECKWSEKPPTRIKGFESLAARAGEENILSRTVITPLRGHRRLRRRGLTMDDSVELRSLS